MPYRVKNWEKFQHYKDRKPPWIKLQRDLLDDYEFHCLPVASRALAPMLWLLASENEDVSSGIIDGDDDRIAFRLRQSVKDFLAAMKPLISKGFVEVLQDASMSLSSQEHHAIPETEGEAEAKREAEGRPPARKVRLDDLSVDHIRDWLSEQRGMGRYVHHDEHFVLDQFKNYCASKGKRYEDYIAGYRNAFEWDRCKPKQGSNDRAPTKDERARAAVMRAAAAAGLVPAYQG